MNVIDVDIETRSACDLKKAGVTRYAKDSSTKVLCVCYCCNGGPILTWLPGMPVPSEFQDAFVMVAHNAAFERAIWRNILIHHGFKWPHHYVCTMTAAYQRNLPAALVDTAPALGLSVKKDEEGRRLMLKMSKHDYEETVHNSWHKKCFRKSKPISNTTTAWFLAEEQIIKDTKRLIEYCIHDVIVEREIHKHIKMMEQDLYDLDLVINARGIWVDVDTSRAVLACIDQELIDLNEELRELTGKAVSTGRQVARLLEWLRDQNYMGEDLSAEAVKLALDQPGELTPKGIRALEIRQKLALGSVGKFKAILNGYVSENGKKNSYRLHDLIQFRGAAQTGRYAGRRVQLQNLPRLEINDDQIELLIKLFHKGDRETIKFLFGDVFYAAKQLIRPMFGSREGLIVSDFAQIEARVLAWISRQHSLLEAFTADNRDPYVEMAAKIYHKYPEDVIDSERFIGKMCVLGCGYGLGGKTFTEQVNSRGGDISYKEGQSAVDAFRDTYKSITSFWYRTGDAMIDVINEPNTVKPIGWNMEVQSYLINDNIGATITLPSGRRLYYHDCKLVKNDWDFWSVEYIGASLERTRTYGGKLTENICQAIANDILNEAMKRLSLAGFRIVLNVHDEVVIERVQDIDTEKITRIMEGVPFWAEGLPLKAETKFCKTGRYTK